MDASLLFIKKGVGLFREGRSKNLAGCCLINVCFFVCSFVSFFVCLFVCFFVSLFVCLFVICVFWCMLCCVVVGCWLCVVLSLVVGCSLCVVCFVVVVVVVVGGGISISTRFRIYKHLDEFHYIIHTCRFHFWRMVETSWHFCLNLKLILIPSYLSIIVLKHSLWPLKLSSPNLATVISRITRLLL